MKKTFFVLILVLCSLCSIKAQTTDLKYKDYKNQYDTESYEHQPDDPYSLLRVGIASAIIPGFGQTLCGEGSRGSLFMIGGAALAVACFSRADLYSYQTGNDNIYPGHIYHDPNNKRKTDIIFQKYFFLLAALYVGYDIYNICDAVHIAKVKNMYYQDLKNNTSTLNMSLEPFLSTTIPPYSSISLTSPPVAASSVSPVAGVTLKLSF